MPNRRQVYEYTREDIERLQQEAAEGLRNRMHNERDSDKGLYNKYVVERIEPDPTGKHRNCWYFVLDLEHDAYAYAALDMYASSCADKYPQLAEELKGKLKEYTIRKQVATATQEAINILQQQGYKVVSPDET